MTVLFVTGSDRAFFNTLLVCLQSFAEQLPGHRLLVCDFGLIDAQATFLRRLGLLLERPPVLVSRGAFHCKASLVRYLLYNGCKIEDADAVVWLDADITLMKVGIVDFAAVIADMTAAGAPVAATRELSGKSVGQVAGMFAETSAMAPFARRLAQAGIDAQLPYFSNGLFFCRSARFLSSWDELTLAVDFHPLVDQNMFNVALHRDAVALVALDCEEWQAYGYSLDKIQLDAAAPGGRPSARIGNKNIKTLHASSPASGHLLIAECRLTVRELDLIGPFKLFLSEPLRMHQLQLLASFVVTHGEALLGLGLCTRAARPIAGFQFVTL